MQGKEKRKEREKGFYKRGNVWWFAYTKQGRQYHKSTKNTDLSKAIKFKEEYLNNLDNENLTCSGSQIEDNEISLFDFVVLKFLDEKERTCRDKTIESYKYLLKKILIKFSGCLIHDIKKKDIRDYEEFRLMNGCSEGLLIKELKLLKEIFNYACELDIIDYNLFISYKITKKLKDYEPKERFLTPQEARELIENCNEYLKRLVIFALETGMRIKEITNLCFIDIATEPQSKIQFARVRKDISKNKKERFIPLSILAMEQVNKQKLEFPNSSFIFTDSKGNFYKTTPKTAMNTAFRKAGLKEKGDLFHILRHTFASLKLQGLTIYGERVQPKPIELISQILGHSSIDITLKVYAKFSKESLIKILN